MRHTTVTGDSRSMTTVKQLVNIVTIGSDTAEEVSEEILSNGYGCDDHGHKGNKQPSSPDS